MTSPILDGMIPDHLRVRSGRVIIDSLEVMADIGFHEFEVGTPQRLLVSVDIWLDGALKPPPADERAAAWNYDFVVEEIRRMATSRRYNLQETLAHALFERLSRDSGPDAEARRLSRRRRGRRRDRQFRGGGAYRPSLTRAEVPQAEQNPLRGH